ncbi:MAG: hypothetical protein ACRC31_00970 [Cetobacterium sp.]
MSKNVLLLGLYIMNEIILKKYYQIKILKRIKNNDLPIDFYIKICYN